MHLIHHQQLLEDRIVNGMMYYLWLVVNKDKELLFCVLIMGDEVEEGRRA